MSATVTSPTAASTGLKPNIGADLKGWSALPLLAGASIDGRPWLFLTDAATAWLSEGPLSDAQFVRVAIEAHRPWPAEGGTLGGVVIDGEALGRSSQRIESALREAVRTAGIARNVLIVCRHRYLPRQRGAWREYGRPSADRWIEIAAQLGTTASPVAGVSLDGDRITHLTQAGETRSASSAASLRGDRIVLGLDRATAATTVLDELIADASRAAGSTLRIDAVQVRKIGKTAVFVSDASQRRFIVRITRTPIARSRACRNYDALASLHSSAALESLRTLAPAPIGRGSYGGYSYFVESCLTGSTRPDTRGGWSTAAADYITALHGATQRRDSMNGDTIGRLVQAPIACVEQACGTADATQVLRQVERACTAMLRDRTMPLVLAHGDYTESNCLFDSDGRLSGVVDWEVSAQDALPFLDLLQLMPVPGEVSTAPRWQRFDAWMQLIERPQQVSADPVMARYVQALDVPAPAIPALILLQWITHLADRIEARRDDERWMRLRVWQPLESVGAFLPN